MAIKKQENTILDTIKNNYVSAIIGLVIVILGIGYISNSLSTKNKALNNEANQNQEQVEGDLDTISGRSYKVRKGDTLWSIAEAKYQSGYNYTDIVTANKLRSANSIEVGQVLTLPDVPSKLNTVKKIQVKVQVTVKPTLKPSIKPSLTPLPTQIAKQTTPQPKISITGTSYTIQKGDHLWGIAVRAYGDGYKWTKIWNANKKMISNPNLIYAGNKLVLPR